MKSKKDHYSFIAKSYDIILGPLLKSIRNKVVEASKIKKNDSILEIACGTGEQALLFAQKGAIVTGVDISKSMLEVAKQKNKGYEETLNFIYSDATKLQFSDNKFDISTITLALHEMDPVIREKIIKQMIRVTKNGGKIIIVDYTIPKSKKILSTLYRSGIWLIERIAGGYHYKNYRHFMKHGGLQGLIKNLPVELKAEKQFYSNNLSIFQLSKK